MKLTYKGTDFITGYWMKEYAANRKDCEDCPLQNQCMAYKKSRTTMRKTVDKPYYDRMHIRMQTLKAKILMKLRQSTVEPVIGSLVNYTGIKRVNTKGLSQANKCLTMADVAYNLKKMPKYQPRMIESNLNALKNHFNELLTAIYLSPTVFEFV